MRKISRPKLASGGSFDFFLDSAYTKRRNSASLLFFKALRSHITTEVVIWEGNSKAKMSEFFSRVLAEIVVIRLLKAHCRSCD